MIGVIRILLDLFKNYGIGVVQTAIICWGLYIIFCLQRKIATNHLAHIADDIKKIFSKVEEVKEEVGDIKERVSKIEGKVGL